MLRHRAIQSFAGLRKYFDAELTRADYLSEKGASPGTWDWVGYDYSKLGLSRDVNREDLDIFRSAGCIGIRSMFSTSEARKAGDTAAPFISTLAVREGGALSTQNYGAHRFAASQRRSLIRIRLRDYRAKSN